VFLPVGVFGLGVLATARVNTRATLGAVSTALNKAWRNAVNWPLAPG
jgi:hypothetical protein